MNGHTAKRVRRAMRKQRIAFVAQGINEIADLPLGKRIKFAWRILTGRGVQR